MTTDAKQIVERPFRCQVTGNPVGTDTRMIGKPCECDVCRLHDMWSRAGQAALMRQGVIERSVNETRGVPDGWRLVPIEPTREMVAAAFEARDHVGNALSRAAQNGFASGVMCVYAAMLETAPNSPAP